MSRFTISIGSQKYTIDSITVRLIVEDTTTYYVILVLPDWRSGPSTNLCSLFNERGSHEKNSVHAGLFYPPYVKRVESEPSYKKYLCIYILLCRGKIRIYKNVHTRINFMRHTIRCCNYLAHVYGYYTRLIKTFTVRGPGLPTIPVQVAWALPHAQDALALQGNFPRHFIIIRSPISATVLSILNIHTWPLFVLNHLLMKTKKVTLHMKT